MPSAIDVSIVVWLNQWVGRSARLDQFFYFVSDCDLLRGGVLATVYWYCLFRGSASRPAIGLDRRRVQLLGTLLLVAPALFLTRLLAHVLPFSVRPFASPALHLSWPAYGRCGGLPLWSSFPSDHAVMFVAVAAGLFFYRGKRTGLLAFGYVVALILFPRLYLGYHWPIDILAGAVLGVLTAAVFFVPAVVSLLERIVDACMRWSYGTFMALLFLLTYEVATMYTDTRLIVHQFLP